VILVDSNVLIDIFNDDLNWADWSYQQIDQHFDTDDIVVNQMVVAEVAPRFASITEFQEEIHSLGLSFVNFGADAAFETGKAFLAYRHNRGRDAPPLPLPDFFIGGHALVANATILTRDPRFYRSYFPTVPLITPDKAHS
jgi:predicted nucleic acid-binding protein